MKQAQETLRYLNELREMLLKTWEEGIENELGRIKSIKSLYEDIILTNKKILGTNET